MVALVNTTIELENSCGYLTVKTVRSIEQWDLIRHQTEWGQSPELPYVHSVLMHNLNFYREFMAGLQKATHRGDAEVFIQQYVTNEQADLLIQAGGGDG